MLRLTLLLGFCLLGSLVSAGPVSDHGRLRTAGNRIVGAHGETVSLAGMSLFWSQWEGDYYNADTLAWLRSDWHITLIRAALGVGRGGEIADAETEFAKIRAVVDAAIAQDIYVLIDWHDHHAEAHPEAAIAFFTAMARAYGDQPHIIYEIYNEPLRVTWADTVKPYAEQVIAAIRAIDPDNLIVVGTPFWSQRVDEAAADRLDDPNVAYALHYYAGTHKAELRARATAALDAGVALFVTEWGTVNANGNGAVDEASVREWFAFLRAHHLSHANWAVSNKDEGASILKPGVTTLTGWTADDLTPSGTLVRNLIRGWSADDTSTTP